jgi:anti-sigma B factor antagonist
MSVSHQLADGQVAVIKIGEKRLDAVNATNLRNYVADLINKGRDKIVVDLSGLEFMDSSGLGAIVACKKLAGSEGYLRVSGAQGAVQELFRITRMDKLFQSYHTVDEALAG